MLFRQTVVVYSHNYKKAHTYTVREKYSFEEPLFMGRKSPRSSRSCILYCNRNDTQTNLKHRMTLNVTSFVLILRTIRTSGLPQIQIKKKTSLY
jgi:uncharacterized protein YlbG (UPF0298 family)